MYTTGEIARLAEIAGPRSVSCWPSTPRTSSGRGASSASRAPSPSSRRRSRRRAGRPQRRRSSRGRDAELTAARTCDVRAGSGGGRARRRCRQPWPGRHGVHASRSVGHAPAPQWHTRPPPRPARARGGGGRGVDGGPDRRGRRGARGRQRRRASHGDRGGVSGATVVDDTYNASPVSVAAALAFLAETPLPAGRRRIAVLGDMLELGPDEERLHREIGARAARERRARGGRVARRVDRRGSRASGRARVRGRGRRGGR